jgi:TIR domain
MKAVEQNGVDFFISRAGADAPAADLIAAIIREAGLVPFYQNEDFGHADFMRGMEQGYASSARMIALLSAEYQQSEHCRAEYNHVLARDPANLEERLIVLRVGVCDPVGSLQNLAYTDLVPVMSDRAALARVVRVAIGVDRRPSDLQFWQPLRRAGQQIRHPEIRAFRSFTGRTDLLESLDHKLWAGRGTVAIRNSVETTIALRGLGGVGKTLLAQEYAWRNNKSPAQRPGFVGEVALGIDGEKSLDRTDDIGTLGCCECQLLLPMMLFRLGLAPATFVLVGPFVSLASTCHAACCR